MRRRTTRITTHLGVATATVALLGTVFAPAAHAEPETVITGLAFPLSIAVGPDGTVFAASTDMDTFGGMLTMAAPGGESETIYVDEAAREVGAVSVAGDVVTFATTDYMTGAAMLYTLTPGEDGWDQAEVADLGAIEQAENLDGGTKYGIVGLKKGCKKQFKKKQKWMLPYKGIIESHPYASTTLGGTTYVADAAANAILAVTDGEVASAAVLPPTKIKLTKSKRKALKLPKCAQGKTFKVEPVPTDVEAGPDGNLYVTTLPGGPEDPAMGANGSIYQLVPGTGEVNLMGSGFVSPTGLAITPTGTSYVSMLFAGLVMQIPFGGSPTPFVEVANGPADVEYHDGYVYIADTGFMSEDQVGGVIRVPVG